MLQDFWDSRYENIGGNNNTKDLDGLFDWYNDYDALAPLLQAEGALGNTEAVVLSVGCGNSSLSEKMYDAGHRNVVGIDFCESIVEFMRARARRSRPELKYEVMDARELSFGNESFDLIIDKGTLDAVVCGTDVKSAVRDLLSGLSRVLRPGALLLVMSYGRPDDRQFYLEDDEYGWTVSAKTLPKPKLKNLQEGISEGFTVTDYLPTGGGGSMEDSHFIYLCRKNDLKD